MKTQEYSLSPGGQFNRTKKYRISFIATTRANLGYTFPFDTSGQVLGQRINPIELTP